MTHDPYHFEGPVVWHACFHRGKSWWGRRWQHVSLAAKTEETWVNLDLHRHGVSIATVYRYDDVQDYLSFLLTYYDVVRVERQKFIRRNFGHPMTCVSFVKHALGVRSGALRPDSLFRSLLEDHNGEWLNETYSLGNTGAGAAEEAG